MTYTVSGANFNKDVAAQGTSINYKENKAVKSEGRLICRSGNLWQCDSCK